MCVVDAQLFGAELKGRKTTLATPLARRVDLMGVTMKAHRHQVCNRGYHQLLGTWVYMVGFRKEALSILQESYSYLNDWPDGAAKVDSP